MSDFPLTEPLGPLRGRAVPPLVILPANAPRMFRGFLKESVFYKRSLSNRDKDCLAELIEAGVKNLGWGANTIAVSFFPGPCSRIVVSIVYLNLDETGDENLEGPLFAEARPLPYEHPEVKRVVDEIVQPAVREVLGNRAVFELTID